MATISDYSLSTAATDHAAITSYLDGLDSVPSITAITAGTKAEADPAARDTYLRAAYTALGGELLGICFFTPLPFRYRTGVGGGQVAFAQHLKSTAPVGNPGDWRHGATFPASFESSDIRKIVSTLRLHLQDEGVNGIELAKKLPRKRFFGLDLLTSEIQIHAE